MFDTECFLDSAHLVLVSWLTEGLPEVAVFVL